MHQHVRRRHLLERSATAALGWAGVALLTACGGAANVVTSAASSATGGQTTASTPATSAAAAPAATSRQVSSIATSTVAPSTTLTSTSAPVASTSRLTTLTGSVALRIGSWLVRPTNKAVFSDHLIAPYQQLHPNAKITVEYTSGTDAHITKMIAESAAGDPPDIIEVDLDDNQSFADKHVLTALDPLIARSKIDVNNYVKAALDLGRYPQTNGKYWAWQTMLGVGVLFYNKTLFHNAGVSFPTDTLDYQTTFLDLAQKLTKKGADPSSSFWGFNLNYYTRTMLFSFGFQEVSDDGKTALFDSPESIAAHQFWVDLLNKYQVSMPSSAVKTLGGTTGPFSTGHVAMDIEGSYSVQSFQQLTSMDWDVAMPPKGPAGQFAVIKGSPAHGLSPLSKHQDDAWEFLSWWIINETPDQVVNPGNLPSRLVALQDWAAAQRKANPVPAGIGKFAEIASKLGKSAQIPPHSAEVWDAYTKVRDDILAGKVGVADGLHAAAQQINGLLAQP